MTNEKKNKPTLSVCRWDHNELISCADTLQSSDSGHILSGSCGHEA